MSIDDKLKEIGVKDMDEIIFYSKKAHYVHTISFFGSCLPYEPKYPLSEFKICFVLRANEQAETVEIIWQEEK